LTFWAGLLVGGVRNRTTEAQRAFSATDELSVSQVKTIGVKRRVATLWPPALQGLTRREVGVVLFWRMSNVTRDQARKLLEELKVDSGLCTHSEGVAHRAETVCRILSEAGHAPDTEQVVVAALLHDVGRARSDGLNHAVTGAQMLLEHGFEGAAELVRVHALPQTAELSLEAKVLIYADITTGPDGEAIDPMRKLEFLRRLGEEWKNEEERLLAKKAYEVKRRIVSEIDLLIKQAMAGA